MGWPPLVDIHGNRMSREEFLADPEAVQEYLLTDPTSFATEEQDFYCAVASFYRQPTAFCDRSEALKNNAKQFECGPEITERPKLSPELLKYIEQNQYERCVKEFESNPYGNLLLTDICVEGGEEAVRQILKINLQAAAFQLVKHAMPIVKYKIPGGKLALIVVEHKKGPMALYERGPQGEFFILLNRDASDLPRAVYQFSHELCHVLCLSKKEDDRNNKWFEEALCEAASHFVLRRLADGSELKNFKDAYRSYLSRIEKKTNPIPAGQTFQQWYQAHKNKLRGTNEARELYKIIASEVFIPILEKSPYHWNALAYLNKAFKKNQTFEEYLVHWHQNTPIPYRSFIQAIAKKFGINIEE